MLKIPYDYAPMEARCAPALPEGNNWQFEPKWDGFRCLAFRDGAEITLRSKNNKKLERYFPELVHELSSLKSKRFVLDGEIVVPDLTGFSFDRLLERIHPAQSRIQKLSESTPALFIVFDILLNQSHLIANEDLFARRKALEQFASEQLRPKSCIELSPASKSRKAIDTWQKSLGGKLDGIVAKQADLPYQSGNRNGMVKVKNLRTADCVVGGFRWAKENKVPASLLLGLFDEKKLLHHVGFCSAFSEQERKELVKLLLPLRGPSAFTGASPGGPSRWSQSKEGHDWEPLKEGLVGEFRYDHFSDGRFRHGTKLLRWRPDKNPRQCTFDQIR